MRFGEISGIDKPVARVVQGTTMIGGDLDEAQSFALLDEVFEAGCNTLDTAHGYSGGNSERIIGRWLQARGLGGQMVIITKGAAHSEDRRRMTAYDLAADLHDSLARLRLETIDLYLLHRDDAGLPVEPIMEALNEHIRAGKIRAIGASNWSVERIEAANAYAGARGLEPFAVSSPQFGLAECMAEPWPLCLSISGPGQAAAREWYSQNRMPLLAWSPLASGFFSGRFRRDNLHLFGEREWDRVCIQSYATEANFRRLDRAGELAAERGITAAQVALAYVMNDPMNVFMVTGSTSGETFRMTVAAGEVQLTAEEMAWLDLRSETR